MHLFLAANPRDWPSFGLVIKPAERVGSRSLYSLAFGKDGTAFRRIGAERYLQPWTTWLASVHSQAFGLL